MTHLPNPGRTETSLAALEHTGEQIRAATEPDPDLEPLEQLHAGLSRYLDLMAADPPYFLAVHRIAAADDEVGAVVHGWQSGPMERIYSGLPVRWRTPRTRRVARLWTAHVVTLALEWLEHPESSSREELAEHCLHLFRNSLARAVEAESPR